MHPVKEYLNFKGISHRKLANMSGVDHSMVSRVLRGERQPSREMSEQLSEPLGLPPEVFTYPDRWRIYTYSVDDQQLILLVPIQTFHLEVA